MKKDTSDEMLRHDRLKKDRACNWSLILWVIEIFQHLKSQEKTRKNYFQVFSKSNFLNWIEINIRKREMVRCDRMSWRHWWPIIQPEESSWDSLPTTSHFINNILVTNQQLILVNSKKLWRNIVEPQDLIDPSFPSFVLRP